MTQSTNDQQPGGQRRFQEEVEVAANQLVDTVKQLIHEGNVRRIIIRQDGRTVMELPLTFAAIGIAVAPVLAAVGAFAALASNCTIVVERAGDNNQV